MKSMLALALALFCVHCAAGEVADEAPVPAAVAPTPSIPAPDAGATDCGINETWHWPISCAYDDAGKLQCALDPSDAAPAPDAGPVPVVLEVDAGAPAPAPAPTIVAPLDAAPAPPPPLVVDPCVSEPAISACLTWRTFACVNNVQGVPAGCRDPYVSLPLPAGKDFWACCP